MLDKIGVKKLDDLYSDVPAEFLHKGAYALPPAMSEQEIRDCFASLEAMNAKLKVFVGAGAYDHYTPSVIPYLCARSEFLTAYTPYQCEISQGTLRYIFEYQSLICSLTGLDVSNASLYDGPTAAAEAMKMAIACTRKKTRVLLSKGLLPHVIEVVETYARFHGVEIGYVPVADGQTSLEGLKAELAKDDVAGVIVPSINFCRCHPRGERASHRVLRPVGPGGGENPGRVGCGYCHWRRSAPGPASLLRRPVRRLYGREKGPYAQDARPHCGADGG